MCWHTHKHSKYSDDPYAKFHCSLEAIGHY